MIGTYRSDCVLATWYGGDTFPHTNMLPYLPKVAEKLGKSVEVAELAVALGGFNNPDSMSRTPWDKYVRSLQDKFLPAYRRELDNDMVVMSQYSSFYYQWVFGVRADALLKTKDITNWEEGWRHVPSISNELFTRATWETWLTNWKGLIYLAETKPVGRSIEVLPSVSTTREFHLMVEEYAPRFQALWNQKPIGWKEFKKTKSQLVEGLLGGLAPTQATYGRRILGA